MARVTTFLPPACLTLSIVSCCSLAALLAFNYDGCML